MANGAERAGANRTQEQEDSKKRRPENKERELPPKNWGFRIISFLLTGKEPEVLGGKNEAENRSILEKLIKGDNRKPGLFSAKPDIADKIIEATKIQGEDFQDSKKRKKLEELYRGIENLSNKIPEEEIDQELKSTLERLLETAEESPNEKVQAVIQAIEGDEENKNEVMLSLQKELKENSRVVARAIKNQLEETATTPREARILDIEERIAQKQRKRAEALSDQTERVLNEMELKQLNYERTGRTPPEMIQLIEKNPVEWLDRTLEAIEIDPENLSTIFQNPLYQELLLARPFLNERYPQLLKQLDARLKLLIANAAIRLDASFEQIQSVVSRITAEDWQVIFRTKDAEVIDGEVKAMSEYIKEMREKRGKNKPLYVVSKFMNLLEYRGEEYAPLQEDSTRQEEIEMQIMFLAESYAQGILEDDPNKDLEVEVEEGLINALKKKYRDEVIGEGIAGQEAEERVNDKLTETLTQLEEKAKSQANNIFRELREYNNRQTEEDKRINLNDEIKNGLFQAEYERLKMEMIEQLAFEARKNMMEQRGELIGLTAEQAKEKVKRQIRSDWESYLEIAKRAWRAWGRDIYFDREWSNTSYLRTRVHLLPLWLRSQGIGRPFFQKLIREGSVDFVQVNIELPDLLSAVAEKDKLPDFATKIKAFKDNGEKIKKLQAIQTAGGEFFYDKSKKDEEGKSPQDYKYRTMVIHEVAPIDYKTNKNAPFAVSLKDEPFYKLNFMDGFLGNTPLAKQADQETKAEGLRQAMVGTGKFLNNPNLLTYQAVMEAFRHYEGIEKKQKLGKPLMDKLLTIRTEEARELQMEPLTVFDRKLYILTAYSYGYINSRQAYELFRKHVPLGFLGINTAITFWLFVELILKDLVPILGKQAGEAVVKAAAA